MKIFLTFLLAATCLPGSLQAIPSYQNKPVRVFIFSGQSNMAGSGNPGDAPEAIRTQPQVLFDVTSAGDATTESTDWEELGTAPGGMGPEFAAADCFTQAYPDSQICIIKVSRAATGLGYWRTPGSAGYESLMARIDTIASRLNAAVASGSIPSWSYAGFLWLQGENEADGVAGPALSYKADFNDLATKVRARTGVAALPVVLGRISNLLDPALGGPVEQPQLDYVRAGQTNWPAEDGHGAWVDTDNLTLVDGFHFGSASQLVIGRRFAEAWFSAAEPRPRLVLSRAASQPNRSESPAILYTARFSGPVSGFTSSDVVVTGNTGATNVAVAETAPFDGTAYEVRVRGMAEPGMVVVGVGNAAATSGTLASLPAIAENTDVLWTESSEVSGLILYDPMDPAPRVLNGSRAGTGWQGSGWNVQNGRTGYVIQSGTPMTYPGLVSSPGYARGGDTYVSSARPLDLENTFRPWMTSRSAGAVDLPGSTLWMSCLIRPETSGRNQAVSLNRNTGTGSNDSTAGVDQNGGTWRFTVMGTAYDTGIAVVNNQTYLMVMKLQIGGSAAPSTAQLWVNPPSASLGGSAPATPTASHTVTNASFKFSRLFWYPGSGAGNGALDEIRIGTNYAAVTPREPAPLTSVEGAVRQQFAAKGADHLPVANFDPSIDYDGDGLTGAEEVLWAGNAADAANTGNAFLTVEQKRTPPAAIRGTTDIQIDVTGPDPLPSGFAFGISHNTTLESRSWQTLAPGADYALTTVSQGNGLATYRATLPFASGPSAFWRGFFAQ